MMNSKPRPPNNYQMHGQYNPRYAGPPGQNVSQQGSQPGMANRNPNAPTNMRGPSGPRQQQPQQSQVHQQQPHGGVTGVSVSHQHHNMHAAAPQVQAAPQQQQQVYAAQYPPAHNPGMQYPPQIYQSYGQPMFSPQAGYPNVRFVHVLSPGNQTPGGYYYHNPQNPVSIIAATQHQQNANSQAVGQHQQQQQHFYPNVQGTYVQQHRLPTPSVHGVPHGVQIMPIPTPHPNAHQPQHQPQHGHPHAQVAQTAAVSNQLVNRGEGVPAPAPERKREKRILKIVDPSTGENVIGDTTATPPAPSAEPAQRSATPTEGNGDVTVAVASATDAQEDARPSEASNAEDSTVKKTVTQTKEEVVTASDESTTPLSAPAVDPKSSKARAEFFQKITQASDDGNVGKTSTTVSQASSVSPVSPIPGTQAPEPESPVLDSSKSQQAAVTPSANVSSDDSKDASLISVSPTPIEHYGTPRSQSSPHGQANSESFLEEDSDETSDRDKSLIEAPVVIEEPKVVVAEKSESSPVVQSPVPPSDEGSSQNDEEVKEVIPASDEPPAPEEKLVEPLVNDKKNLETTAVQADTIHQNGDIDLEDGEIPTDTGADSGGDDSESNEGPGLEAKTDKKIKYDRDFLMHIRTEVDISKKPRTDLIPDVLKEFGANQMKGHHGTQNIRQSPGGQRDQFQRNNRGPPVKTMMGGPMGNYQRGNHGQMMGMGQWGMGIGGPLMMPSAPPPRPPKVLELQTREEVKLHKAENAWKPGAIKQQQRSTAGSDQELDEEEAITADIVKKTRGILNKLTPENFEKLVQKFMGLPLEDKEARIARVIKVVFEKAVDEPSFSKEYAKMVHKVCSSSAETSRKFRKQILDQCQQEFQKSNTDEDKIKILEEQLQETTENDKKAELKAELEDTKFQTRRRSLGNVRFIGELYKLKMLTPKIMVECVMMLLNASDEESLESLCKLLTTVGNNLDEELESLEKIHKHNKDNPTNQMKAPKFVPEDKWMTKRFNQLKILSENVKLSSRIRFAILDVVELKENNWKPRRDTNAPKTIDEVRRDAYRQEMEEKRQISSLPPPSMSDQRGGGPNSRQPAGQQQTKKGDWNTVQSNKSSRFQTKKADQGTTPVLGPPSLSWGTRPGPGSGSNSSSGMGGPPSQSSKPTSNLPPRFQQQQQMNRFQGLSNNDENRLNSNNQQPSSGYRDQMPPSHMQFQQPQQPAYKKLSPPTSSASSRENSRPVSPKDSMSSAKESEITADVNETVKNIFEEYVSVGKSDDTLHWIQQRFAGPKISDFVDELARQVSDMNKLTMQQKAGTLTRALIKANLISKDVVLKTLADGVISELPDIQIDSPMVVNYIAQYLIEIFNDEQNLDWLLSFREALIQECQPAWEELVDKTLNMLKAKANEEVVQSLYAKTKDNLSLPITNLPWLSYSSSPEQLAQKMIPVLRDNLQNNEEEIRQLLKENSWDVRETLTSRGLIEAICSLTWTLETREWNIDDLHKLLPLLPLPNPNLFPTIWKQATEFSVRSNIEKAQKEELWGVMYSLNLATAPEPTTAD